MNASLSQIVADPETILALEPEDLAGFILQFWNEGGVNEVNPSGGSIGALVDGYPDNYRERLERAGMEAWAWLIREGLVAPVANVAFRYFITRRGKQITTAGDLRTYSRATVLPKAALHPLILQKVYGTFLRGDYDTAVFQAFKEVEVAVRQAGNFAPGDLGVTLMRNAFHPENGPLRAAIKGERQAISDLFAGAIGSFKNPASHRSVDAEPEGAAALVMFASHLLRMVDQRAVSADQQPDEPDAE